MAPALKGGGFREEWAGPPTRRNPIFPPDRVCAVEGCGTRLSIYNAWERCWQHEPRREFRR